MSDINILDIDTVCLNEENCSVTIIDQTLLPGDVKLIELTEAKQIWDAIYLLQVRGAPAIGVCAALSMYVLSERFPAKYKTDYETFMKKFHETAEYLNSSRPTAVNLSWALKRMCQLVDGFSNRVVLQNDDSSNAVSLNEVSKKGFSKNEQSEVLSGNLTIDKENSSDSDKIQDGPELVRQLIAQIHDEAVNVYNEDIWVCRKLGEYGVTLIHDGDGLLTHCNAGKLATVRYGTATAPMYLAHEKGMDIHVYCDETRPLLQGARLTAFELSASGIDTTLQCDNMSASLMKAGKIQEIFVGCDRVAANGDAANKIGTSVVAAVAKKYGVPMYVVAPTSTIDMNTKTGDDIVIEQRKPEEVTEMWYKKRMAPENIHVYNPAFDVTDHEDLAGIVTEFGIATAPYEESFKEIFKKKADYYKTVQNNKN